jgi:hypothetical protein
MHPKSFAQYVADEMNRPLSDPEVQEAIMRKMGYVIRIRRRVSYHMCASTLECLDHESFNVQVVRLRENSTATFTVNTLAGMPPSMLEVLHNLIVAAQLEAQAMAPHVAGRFAEKREFYKTI